MSPVLLSTTLHQSGLLLSIATVSDLASLGITSLGSSTGENFCRNKPHLKSFFLCANHFSSTSDALHNTSVARL